MVLINSNLQYFNNDYFLDLVRVEEFPANIYLFNVNKRNTRKKCEICSKLTIKTERRQYESLVSSVSIVDFEQVNVCWVATLQCMIFLISNIFTSSSRL